MDICYKVIFTCMIVLEINIYVLASSDCTWSSWGRCSTSGRQTREFRCCGGGIEPFALGDLCPANDVQIRDCLCVWTEWGECSAACGETGTRTRENRCCHFLEPVQPLVLSDCITIIDSQTESCTKENAVWGPWGGWAQCSVTCGYGSQTRKRVCTYPVPSNGCTCGGSDTNTRQCYIEPVHIGWGLWGTYTVCTRTCGTGTRTRRRLCNNPAPTKCGNTCSGLSSQTMNCNTQGCPLDGYWGAWNGWSQCSVTCGQGTRQRQRECNNPVQENGGKTCSGSDMDDLECNIQPVHGGWGLWSLYTTCSETCGSGTRTRTRACNNPTPANCGNSCSGETMDTAICSIQPCPETSLAAQSTSTTTPVTVSTTSTVDTSMSYTKTKPNPTTTITVQTESRFRSVADAATSTTSTTVQYDPRTVIETTSSTPRVRTESIADTLSIITQLPVTFTQVMAPSEVPQIIRIWPNYGPQVGGTIITVQGFHLPLDSAVKIGDGLFCETTFKNDTHLLVVTPTLEQIEAVGKVQQIYIVLNTASVLETSYVFVYKGNPVISAVYPKQTIKQGGTQLTVLGSNLNSVAIISMGTTMVLKELLDTQPPGYNVSVTKYNTVCNTKNSTHMLCPTPTIDLPPGFLINTSRRKRRFISKVAKSLVKSRARRDVKIQFSHDGDILEFYIGFYMDGVDDYKNYTIIDVCVEPEFIFGTEMREYSNGGRLKFEGYHLDVGVSVQDYNITIGTELCEELELLSNMLSCHPPDTQPELVEDNEMGHPMIMIHVGLNIQHMAGYLRYPSTTLPLYIIILAAVIPTCAVVIIVIVVVCVKKRR